jgi:mono/diheme cytochrome c family protein
MRYQTSRLSSFFLIASCAALGSAAAAGPAGRVSGGAHERAALVLEKDAYGDGASRVVYLDQGWSPPESQWFYHADQGSVLLPYDLLVHLEQAGNEKPLLEPENMARFRFLNQHKTLDNPDALPIGFARHQDQVGLTCAACHTAQINYRGTAIRIDGGPALIDVSGFFRALKDSIDATLASEAKLDRFVAAVAGLGPPDKRRAAARTRLKQSSDWFQSYFVGNPAPTTEGFARLDAVGRILNQAIRFTSDYKNGLPVNAPTSFPLLWDAPRHDYVQWTGFAPNAGAGGLGRNTGEVVGVFGHVEVKHYETKEQAKRGYPSTINSPALVAMEESLRGLQSPLWPEQILPPIDRKLAARGQVLYKAQCESCHALIVRDDPKRHVTAIMTGVDVVGTDGTAAHNLVSARVPAGVLQGAISPKGSKYGAEVGALELIGNVTAGAVAAHPAAVLLALANSKRVGLTQSPKQGNYTRPSEKDPTADLRAYKARPLNGTWASSPYLHNGSVPTLYDLLLPPAERPKTFAVGRLEFDPRKVGYVSAGESPFVFDTRQTGNSSAGHEYGVTLSADDRWALVEYLKTL